VHSLRGLSRCVCGRDDAVLCGISLSPLASPSCWFFQGRALECLSTVGLAAGAERFRDDAVIAMRGIVELLAASSRGSMSAGGQSAVSGDDPVLMYLWEAVRRIARAIGAAAFAPFVPAVVPPLLVAARAETRVTRIKFGQKSDLEAVDAAANGVSGAASEDNDEDDDADDEDFVHAEDGYAAMVKVKVRLGGLAPPHAAASVYRQLPPLASCLQTTALEEKHSAIWALGAVAGFVRGLEHAHFAADILAALLPCLALAGAPFDDIREAAAASVGDCLIAAASALSAIDVLRSASAGVAAAPGSASSVFHSMLTTSLLALAKAAVADDHIELIKTLVTCVSHVMRDSLRRSNFADASAAEAAGCPVLLPLLGQDVLRELTQLMLQVRSLPIRGLPDVTSGPRDDEAMCLQVLLLVSLQVRQASINRRAVRAAEMVVNADDVDEEEAESNKEKDKDEWTLQASPCFRRHAMIIQLLHTIATNCFLLRSTTSRILLVPCCERTGLLTCQYTCPSFILSSWTWRIQTS
jgi:hypothetical protein